MFTGLVETTGTFRRLTKGSGQTARLALRVPDGFGPVNVGDSVAVNGACLTVVETGSGALEMDVLEETLARTNLGSLRVGERVNLERSLTPSSELGGHIVTGHVDDTGTVLRRTKRGADWVFEIGVDRKYMPFIAPKGSIAVDGISLTVVETGEASFSVHVIPYTFANTTLGDRAEGSRVNIEIDIMARYIANFLQRTGGPVNGESKSLTEKFLAEHGFA
jgi:riboflavin synthase